MPCAQAPPTCRPQGTQAEAEPGDADPQSSIPFHFQFPNRDLTLQVSPPFPPPQPSARRTQSNKTPQLKPQTPARYRQPGSNGSRARRRLRGGGRAPTAPGPPEAAKGSLRGRRARPHRPPPGRAARRAPLGARGASPRWPRPALPAAPPLPIPLHDPTRRRRRLLPARPRGAERGCAGETIERGAGRAPRKTARPGDGWRGVRDPRAPAPGVGDVAGKRGEGLRGGRRGRGAMPLAERSPPLC